jgi:tetratricopeptide (TPR) repeat protein
MEKDAAATPDDAHQAQLGESRQAPQRSRTSSGKWWWLKDVSILVALASVIVAVISANIAYTSSKENYVREQQAALIDYLQELHRLAQNDQLDEDTAHTLVAQARWIVSEVPDVPAAVYRQLGEALIKDSPIYQEDALPLLDRAIELAARTDDEYEEVTARRLKAAIYLRQGNLAAMRNEYQLAVALSDEYSGPNPERRHAVPAFTHVFWGQAEIRFHNCEEAARQYQLAQQHAKHVTGRNLNTLMSDLEKSIQACPG